MHRLLVVGVVPTLGLAIGAAVVVAAPWQQERSAEPLHVVQVGEGVYGIQDPGILQNTGFVVGDDGVFVFTCDPRTLHGRLAAIRSVTDKPIRWFANGHAAPDDAGCNSEFKRLGATLIGSSRMREDYLRQSPRIATLLASPDLQQLGLWLEAPEVTFDDRLTLHLGEGREVHLISMGHGHSIGDTVAYLPEQRVLFSADLTWVRIHPVVAGGDTQNWQRILAELMTWDVDWIVTGHGEVLQGKEVLESLWTYFEVMRERVRAFMREDRSVEEAKAEIDLTGYRDWATLQPMELTVEWLYRELRQAEGGS